MARRRQDRKGAQRTRRSRVAIAAAAAAFVLAVATTAWLIGAPRDGAEAGVSVAQQAVTIEEPRSLMTTSAPAYAVETSAKVDPVVEVPSVEGKTLHEARVLLAAAGLTVAVEEDPATAGSVAGDEREVLAQDPVEGMKVAQGTGVVLTVPAFKGTGVQGATYVVCIDPGHQAKSDTSDEPVGPDATETKDRIRGGTTGVATGIPEYEVTLQIAMNVKSRLEAAGVQVVMTRETNDVNISNAERARMANEAEADLFVRIHCDGNPDQDVNGVSTLYPAPNQWTGGIADESRRAAALVHEAVVAATGAQSRGTVARSDITGFNWAQMPSLLVECGFMSNPIEDKLLSSPHYQDKIAEGMCAGILEYLGR